MEVTGCYVIELGGSSIWQGCPTEKRRIKKDTIQFRDLAQIKELDSLWRQQVYGYNIYGTACRTANCHVFGPFSSLTVSVSV